MKLFKAGVPYWEWNLTKWVSTGLSSEKRTIAFLAKSSWRCMGTYALSRTFSALSMPGSCAHHMLFSLSNPSQKLKLHNLARPSIALVVNPVMLRTTALTIYMCYLKLRHTCAMSGMPPLGHCCCILAAKHCWTRLRCTFLIILYPALLQYLWQEPSAPDLENLHRSGILSLWLHVIPQWLRQADLDKQKPSNSKHHFYRDWEIFKSLGFIWS